MAVMLHHPTVLGMPCALQLGEPTFVDLSWAPWVCPAVSDPALRLSAGSVWACTLWL